MSKKFSDSAALQFIDKTLEKLEPKLANMITIHCGTYNNGFGRSLMLNLHSFDAISYLIWFFAQKTKGPEFADTVKKCICMIPHTVGKFCSAAFGVYRRIAYVENPLKTSLEIELNHHGACRLLPKMCGFPFPGTHETSHYGGGCDH